MPVAKTNKIPAKRSTNKKTNKSRPSASVGGVKSQSSKRRFILSLVVILVLAGVGYGGYYAWQLRSRNKLANNYKANAANYGALLGGVYGQVSARACWKTYSSSRPDEVWILVGRQYPGAPVTINGQKYYKTADSSTFRVFTSTPKPTGQSVRTSSSWWAGTVQLHKIPVGRSAIYNNAFLKGTFRSVFLKDNIEQTTVLPSRESSITGLYKGARTTHTGSNHYVLIKGLPVCDY